MTIAGYTTSEAPAPLSTILEPGVNLCIWHRVVPALLREFIAAEVLPRKIKQSVAWSGETMDLSGLLVDLPHGTGRDLLAEDLRGLAGIVRELTGSERVTLKLESFGGNLCERFHVDRVALRLICSYAGPGTEWLADADVNRAWLGPAGQRLADEESGLLRTGAVVRRLDCFDVALMKGESWPGNSGRGLVHRSPRIADQRRVLFKIDVDHVPGS